MGSEIKVDITIVVNAHKEYILLYKTLRSVARAKRHSERSGLVVETIIILDSPDSHMRDLVTFYSEKSELLIDKVYEISVKSLGAARNKGVEKAKGLFIGFMDGDDLCSEEWITSCYHACRNDKKLIAHPEISLFFENDPHWWRHKDQRDKNFDFRQLLNHNFWLALSFSSRENYERIPYHPHNPSSGFGFEDWHWNSETVLKNLIHISVPGTIHFIRKKKVSESLNFLAASSNCLIPPSDLFLDKKRWEEAQEIALNSSSDKVSRLTGKKVVSLIYSTIKKTFWKPLNKYLSDYSFFYFLKKSIQPLTYNLRRKLGSDLPEWVISECYQISLIEPLIFPNNDFLSKTKYSDYSPKQPREIKIYQDMFLDIFDKSVDVVMIVPWLKMGGADLGIIHHAKSLVDSGLSLLIVTTEPSESTWKSKLPEECMFIEFGKVIEGEACFGDVTLARFLIHKKPKSIHVVNSQLGWKIFEKYGKGLKQNSKLYASIFCDSEITSEGERLGFHSYLPYTSQFLDKVFSDNSWYPQHLCDLYGFHQSLFKTLYFPVRESLLKIGAERFIQSKNVSKRFSIFWAGRLDYQKRPDLLAEICKRLPQFDFYIWGSSLLDKSHRVQKELDKLPNVFLKGSYSSLENLMEEKYDLFLYTSQWDGLPNIILEVASCGIPIVSCIVGGIGDFVDNVTAYPVYKFEKIDEYCDQIISACNNYDIAQEKAKHAYDLIKTRHLVQNFQSALIAQIIGE